MTVILPQAWTTDGGGVWVMLGASDATMSSRRALALAFLWLLAAVAVGDVAAGARRVVDGSQAPERRPGDNVSPGPFAGLRELPLPAADGSMAPQLSPAADGTVIASWLEPSGPHTRLRMARLGPTGWSDPLTVAEGPDFFVNWADVPSVVALGGDRLAAHWLHRSAASPYAYDVRVSLSADRGRTWSAPVKPHRDATLSEHGFVSLYDAPGDALGLAWLDGRQTAGGGHDGHGAGGGAMTLRATTIGMDGRLGQEVLLDGRVCDCCPTAAARTPSGVVVAYRDRARDEVRDIGMVRLEGNRWSAPAPAHADGWLMPACPVNGPSLAAQGLQLALAWFTAEGNEPRVLLAFSTDGGATFGSPVRVDDGVAIGRVDVELLPDGSALVGWIEFALGASEFRVRRVAAGGARGPSVRVAGLAADRASGYPRLARSGRMLVFAWTEVRDHVKHVRAATAPVPD